MELGDFMMRNFMTQIKAVFNLNRILYIVEIGQNYGINNESSKLLLIQSSLRQI